MTTLNGAVRVLAASVLLPAWGAAQERGLAPLERSFAAGLAAVRPFSAAPRPGPVRAAGTAGDFNAAAWGQFPPPDPQTLAWLAARVPGLDAASVRVVPAAVADGVMARAVAAKTTYLDILSDAVFRRKEIYYTPVDALNEVHRRYISGTMPIQGRTEKGAAFQMQAMLAGQGRVELLYDQESFTFKDGEQRFKIENKGRVAAAIRGAGDITLEGLSAYGAPVFCPWAKIQRMTKESMYKVRVETSCGSRGGNDLFPVRNR